MKIFRKKRTLVISGVILLMLLILPVLQIFAEQMMKTPASLALIRSISAESGTDITNGEINKNEPFNLNYTITPSVISGSSITSQQASITDITFRETLPPNVEITRLPSGFAKSGSAASGYTVTASLGDIQYLMSPSKQTFIPDPTSNSRMGTDGKISFSISASAAKTGAYTFGQAALAYDDLHTKLDPGDSNLGSTLGVAGDYGIFAFGQNNGYSGSSGNFTVNGSMAVGGDLTLTNGSGGGVINGNIVVGNTFNYYSAGNIIINGNLTYGKSFNYDANSRFQITGKVKQGTPIDFAAASNFWTAKSLGLSALQATGSTTVKNGNQLYLEAKDKTLPLYVFNVSAAQISQTVGIYLDTPQSSTVIINIAGTNVDMNKWVSFNGKPANKVLYNFYEAKQIKVSSAAVTGTYLAPLASVNATNLSFNGSVIVSAWDFGNSSGISFNSTPFTGILPDTPDQSPPVHVTLNFDSVKLNVTEPADNTPRTLELQGPEITVVNQDAALQAIYSGPKGETGITYTWTVTMSGQTVSGVLTNGASDADKIFHASQVGDYTVTVEVRSAGSDIVTTASKVISVRLLEIDGPDSIFVGKTKDYTLTTGNMPPGAVITWSLPGDGGSYATLTKAAGDTNNTHYTLTGNQIHNGVVVSVTAGGITATRTVNIVPYSLTGLRATGEIELKVGEQRNLNDRNLLFLTPSEMDLSDIQNDLVWTSADPSVASFDEPLTDPSRRGVVTGVQKGDVLVTVTYRPSGNATPISAVIKVKVLPLENGDRY